MNSTTYQRLIVEGIKDLPPETLAEVADFVFFVRRRALQPSVVEEELRSALLNAELGLIDQESRAHLDDEFADYEARFPLE